MTSFYAADMEKVLLRFILQAVDRGVRPSVLRRILTSEQQNNFQLSKKLAVPLFTVATLRRLAFSSPRQLAASLELLQHLKTPRLRPVPAVQAAGESPA